VRYQSKRHLANKQGEKLMTSVIQDFLNDRKEEWLKKKLGVNMDDIEKTSLMQQAQTKYTLKTWLPDAAKRACQLSMTTHPGKFSHPSAKTNPIIASAKKENDGYLRTGNVDYDLDVFGNAAAMDVYKFLKLKLEDGQTVLEHLERGTDQIKAVFGTSIAEFETLRQNFLMIKQVKESQTTDGLVKQIYFPVGQGYHLLSILTPSGLLDKLKKHIDEIRFSDVAKEARDCKKKKAYHPNGYDDLYDLTVTAYGGTKPQNISVLNSQNGGISYLLLSMPRKIEQRSLRLPVRDFFTDTLRLGVFNEIFKSLHGLMEAGNNQNIRNAIQDIIKYVIDLVLEFALRVREHDSGWSTRPHYKKLPHAQCIWLDNIYIQKRKDEEEWFDPICASFARWIVSAYEKVLKKDHILLGDGEMNYIRSFVEEAMSRDKEFFKGDF